MSTPDRHAALVNALGEILHALEARHDADQRMARDPLVTRIVAARAGGRADAAWEASVQLRDLMRSPLAETLEV